MKHHALPAAPKALRTKQPISYKPNSDDCADCGQSLHIAAVTFSLRRARAIFRCADCGWGYAEA